MHYARVLILLQTSFVICPDLIVGLWPFMVFLQVAQACLYFEKMKCWFNEIQMLFMSGSAQHGLGKKALDLFEPMLQANMKHNEISVVGVMFACSHVGLVDDGCCYFSSMSRDYSFAPGTEHYVCIFNLLGHSGCLDEAEDVVNKMQVKLNDDV